MPSLAVSIYSLFLHIKQQDHGLQSSFESGLLLLFPNFQTKAVVGSDDIYLDATPHEDNRIEDELFDSLQPTSVCRHITQVSPSADVTLVKDPSILTSLHQYYSTVKTKRQLNLDVPAGFRQPSTLQRDFHDFLPPGKL